MNNILKNKKIAIVGPANTLNNLNLGSEIDSNDIVIRMNSYHQLNEIDYGKKLTILYHNFYRYLPIPKKETIIIKSSLPIHSKRIRGFFIPRKDKNREMFNSSVKSNKNINHLRYDFDKYIKCFNLGNKKNSRPTTGITTIYDVILNIDIVKEIHIYAMNFGLSNFNSSYKMDKHSNITHNLSEDLIRFIKIFNNLNNANKNKIIIHDKLLKSKLYLS